jgi:HlyD family secretion protein
MKPRHAVTAAVFLVLVLALGGVYLRLRSAQSEAENEASGSSSATVDSASEAARSTAAASAFAAGTAIPVEGAPVERGTFVLWVTAEGEAAALRRAPLAAEVAGPVVEVPVREGEMVGAGQLIARVDATPYDLDLKEAEGALESARAQYRDLTLGDERIEDAAVREERQAQARIRSGLAGAEARVEKARYDLAKTRITAPYAGRVANLAVDVGSRLRTNDSVATIVDVSSIDVDVHVLENEISFLEPGRDATVRFTGLPDTSFPGRVVTVNPVIDPETHLGRVTVRLRNPGARVLPGMHANVRIAGRLYEDRISVPKEALVERSRREVVFVFEPDEPGGTIGRAKWRYVTPGLENEDRVEIVPGEGTEMLKEGEIVLVGGHTTLTHDARVRLAEPVGDAS